MFKRPLTSVSFLNSPNTGAPCPRLISRLYEVVEGWQLVAKRPSANLPADKMGYVFRAYMQAGLHDPMFFEAFMISALVLKEVLICG